MVAWGPVEAISCYTTTRPRAYRLRSPVAHGSVVDHTGRALLTVLLLVLAALPHTSVISCWPASSAFRG